MLLAGATGAACRNRVEPAVVVGLITLDARATLGSDPHCRTRGAAEHLVAPHDRKLRSPR
jgi:hypothetical protein